MLKSESLDSSTLKKKICRQSMFEKSSKITEVIHFLPFSYYTHTQDVPVQCARREDTAGSITGAERETPLSSLRVSTVCTVFTSRATTSYE